MAFGGRLRELFVKYGKVGFGVHMSVSAISVAGLYIAIKNKVDVESLLEKIGLHSHGREMLEDGKEDKSEIHDVSVLGNEEVWTENGRDRKSQRSDVVVASGGALMLALLCNKALFPVRVPITVVLTPPIARFLARRKLVKDSIR